MKINHENSHFGVKITSPEKKLIDSTEHNHSTNFIALIQSVSPLSNSETFAQQLVNLIEMPRRSKQSKPSGVRFEDEPQQSTSQTQTPETPKTDETHTPNSIPATPSDFSADAPKFALRKIFTNSLLVWFKAKDAILN